MALPSPITASPDFWQMPADVTIRLVDDATELASVADQLLEAADMCGIDAEWLPGSTDPSAALLQLAVRCSATSAVTAVVLVRRHSIEFGAVSFTLLGGRHDLMQKRDRQQRRCRLTRRHLAFSLSRSSLHERP